MAANDGASSSRSSSIYDVFLSFRGEDTRNNFTGFLHSALKREGINVFIDSEGLWGGEEIQIALFDAIQQSKISIPVFSKGYADSKWCLMELVEINRCHGSNGQKVLPIFLDVEPRDVRSQEGSFKDSFEEHKKTCDAQKIQSWRDALNEVAGKKGYELKQVNGNQAELVELIVDWALSELSSNRLSDVTNPIGLDARVEDVLSRLKVDLNDVRFVGICGIGGMGKTTIATALYNRIFEKFDMSCFLANVREEASSGPNGVVSLQTKLIYSVSKKEEKICIVDGGKQLIKEKLRGKKVLLILDDVNSSSQLKDLAIDSILFGPGSRIIITTRDEHILNVAEVDKENIYWPTELDDNQSIQLFSLHAFSSDQPPEEYLQLSHDVIQLAGGLPLTLEVLGSTFSDKDNREEEVWKSMLEKLKKIPHDDVYKKLKISYDKLDDNEKSIFLDAACFFVGWNKENVIQLWDACGFKSILAIKKLTQRSLLKFTSSGCNELRMHDQIQAMGRRIVYDENPMELSKRSRIWSYEEFLEVITEPEGAQTLEVIFPEFEYKYYSIPLPLPHCRNFAMMSKLRVLNVDAVQTEGKFPHFPLNLRWLSWNDLVVPANFYHKKLVHMDLSRSQIREAWTNKPQNENERFQKLKFLDLQQCEVSHESLDFSWFPYLETLNLEKCTNMVNLHKSIGDLKSLVNLHLRSTEIEELPNSICSLSSLKVLNLNMCTSLKNMPESIGDLKSLVTLELEGTKIEEIPSSICKLSCLQSLYLSGCSSLKNLPESIGDLKSLVTLDLEGTKIEEIPSSICKLSGLEYLNLSGCSSLKNLPNSIGDLKSLGELDLKETKIEEIPSSICKLNCLRDLILSGCSSLKNLPDSIGDMKSLAELDLKETKIGEIPSSICKLSCLQSLSLSGCSSLKNLPESIGDMKSLVKLDLEGTKIEEIPSSICKLSGLEYLNLSGCSSLKKLPDSIGDMKSLLQLYLKGTKFGEIPSSICKLSCLRDLNLSGCSSLKNLPDSIVDLKSLARLDLKETKIGEIPSSICKLSCLQFLNLSGCSSLKNLPDSIGDMKSLVEFDLKGTKIGKIPSSICKLSCLRDLSLSGCSSLKNLPDSIGDLKSLAWLDLKETKIGEIPSSICKLSCLQSLNLSGCSSLKNLPDSIGDMKSLVKLDLKGTKIGEIPSSICKLSCLGNLILSGCSSLKNLPESIGDMKSLLQLDLEGTKIEEIPSTICKLSGLEYLNLSGCSSLKNLPDSIGDLKSLGELDLKETKIGEIPSSICKLNCLRNLILTGCSSLKNLPESIGDMKSLVKLNLEGAKIEEIPSSICKLSGFEYLNLSGCSSLKNLPDSIGDLKSLESLDLKGTKIEEIPSSICKLSCLQSLYLSGCSSLKNLPESIGDMKSLLHLDLEGTKIEVIPSSICKLSCLQYLYLSGCSSLKNLPESIGDMKSLLQLDLEETKIEEIPSSICKLSCLEYLNLGGCSSLKNLPESIGDLKSLTELDLKETKIGEIPSSICKLSCLQYLYLSGCSSLKNLPESIWDLESLTELDLKETKIGEIPSSICKLSCLEYLNLSGCSSLKNLPESIWDLESLNELQVTNCKTLADTPKWKIHGQGTLLVDEMSQDIDDCFLLNVNDGIDKGLILCFVFDLQNGHITLQEGQLLDISLSIDVSIRRKHRLIIRCGDEMVIEGVEYTARKRDIIYVHHFKGFDWFGIPLKPGIDAIEDMHVLWNIKSSNGNLMPFDCKPKFWKLLLESTTSEQQQQMTNQEEEESITTTARRMTADFFNWSDDEDHGRSHHFVPTQQVGSSTHKTIHHFTSSSNAMEIERSNPVIPQQADEESSNEMIDSQCDLELQLGLTVQGGGQAGRVAEDPNLSQQSLGLSPERLSRAGKRPRLDMDDAGPSGAL